MIAYVNNSSYTGGIGRIAVQASTWQKIKMLTKKYILFKGLEW
jgi:hypothetical protein